MWSTYLGYTIKPVGNKWFGGGVFDIIGPAIDNGISPPGWVELPMWPLSITWWVAFDMGGIPMGPFWNDEKFGELALCVKAPVLGMNSSAPGLDPC